MDRGDDRDRDRMENGCDDRDVCGKHDDLYDCDDRDYDREDAHREGDYSVSLGDGSLRCQPSCCSQDSVRRAKCV